MFTKAKIALAVALVLSSGVAALAGGKDDDGGGGAGGFVIPGSMDGVNPVYHPDIFGDVNAQSAKRTLQQDRSEWGKAPYRR
jgi:hypothetical protein